MQIKVNPLQFKDIAKKYIDDGWIVERIEKVEYYNVRFTKFSGERPRKKSGSFLYHLNRKTLNEICKCFNLPTSSKVFTNIELIEKLRKYKDDIILIAYDSVLKKREIEKSIKNSKI
jgi:hypothetical protein